MQQSSWPIPAASRKKQRVWAFPTSQSEKIRRGPSPWSVERISLPGQKKRRSRKRSAANCGERGAPRCPRIGTAERPHGSWTSCSNPAPPEAHLINHSSRTIVFETHGHYALLFIIYYIKKLFISAVAKTDRVDHAEAWSDHFYRPPGLHYRKKSPGYLPNPAAVCCSNAFRGKGLARFAPGSS